MQALDVDALAASPNALPNAQRAPGTTGRAGFIQGLVRGACRVAPGLAAMAAEQLFVTVFRHKRPRREEAWADGAAAITIPSPRGGLAAWVWGDGPRTVLLVHGWAGRGLQLGALVEPLVSAGYRVVAYDGPAHGASPGRRTNLFELAEGLAAVAGHVGPLSGVIAHSLGTTAVLLAASRHGLDPVRFVAISPMARTATMTSLFGHKTGFSPAVVGEMRARLERRFDFCWDEIEPARLASGFGAESLVVHDRDDLELPASEALELASRLPGAEHLLTTGHGHWRVLRDSAVVAAATDFIIRGDRVIDAAPISDPRSRRRRGPQAPGEDMNLTTTTHFWPAKLGRTIGSWFDFGVDLTGVSMSEEEVALDLTFGRDEPRVARGA